MPVLGPGGVLQFFISDFASDVVFKCENRVGDLSRAYKWLRDALIELSTNVDLRGEFTELEELGPTYNLTAKTQEYDFESNFVPSGDTSLAGLDILIWNDPPANTQRGKLRETHYQHADNIVTTAYNQPEMWYRFSNKVGFVPVPDKAYQVQARLYKLHPINDNAVQQTQVLLPREWHEILILCAVERGWIDREEYDKATALHTLLFGDPKSPSRPGLVAGLKKRRERENWRTEQSLRVVVPNYSWGGQGRR